MKSYDQSNRNRVRRAPKRGKYDQATLFKILDDGYVCHVGFCVEDQPFVIPMAYARNDDIIYLHGASTSRLQQTLAGRTDCCIAVTHFDGIVLARSVFDHSMNYRSAVIFGKAEVIEGEEEKMEALKILTEFLLPGRWEEARKPSKNELKATAIAAVKITEASCKIRTGPPVDQEEDMDLPVWAGTIPFLTVALDPEPDPLLKRKLEVPVSAIKLLKRNV